MHDYVHETDCMNMHVNECVSVQFVYMSVSMCPSVQHILILNTYLKHTILWFPNESQSTFLQPLLLENRVEDDYTSQKYSGFPD